MRAAILALPLLAFSVAAQAQSMGGMNMPGMQMPGMKMGPKPAAKQKGKKLTAAAAKKRTAVPRGRGPAFGAKRPAKAGMTGMKGMSMGASPAAKSSVGHGMADMPGMKMPSMTAGKAAHPQPGGGQDMSAMPGMNMGTSGGKAGQTMPGMDMSKPMQDGDMANMPGMDMGQGGAPAAGQSMQGMSAMPGMDMSQPMAGMKMGPAGDTKPVVGNAAPPSPPTDHAADRIYGPEAMQRSRGELRTEQGGQNFSFVLFNLAEYQARKGRDGYRWDGEAWYGGDLNRFVAKTEGEGTLGRGVGSAEVQALYARTIGPYWDVEGGVRYDIKPNSRPYATIGLEGLAPDNFELNGALFLSDRGDLLARAEGYYDQRLTQRFILQPRVELNLSAQNVPRDRYGSGLVDAEVGMRLRYEVRREFAPYVGVSWQRQFGDTARFSRAFGDSTGGISFVAGIRTWF